MEIGYIQIRHEKTFIEHDHLIYEYVQSVSITKFY
jgi:hypothetical protein